MQVLVQLHQAGTTLQATKLLEEVIAKCDANQKSFAKLAIDD
jgi:hypothetical protein